MSEFITDKARRTYQRISLFIMIASSIVMLGWLLQIEWLVHPIPNNNTMPFATAVLFFLTGITFFLKNKSPLAEQFYVSVGYLLIGSSLLALLQYILGTSFGLDGLLISDNFTDTSTSRIAGRITLIESILFLVLGLTILSTYYTLPFLQKSRELLTTIFTFFIYIALPLIVLQSALDHQYYLGLTSFFSYLFYRLAVNCIDLRYPPKGILRLYTGTSQGSRLVQKVIPFMVLTTTFSGLALLIAIQEAYTTPENAIIVVFISGLLLAVVFAFYLGINTNEKEGERLALELSLQKSISEKNYFQQALENSSMFAILDDDWKYKYVSNNFCKNFGYEQDELIGQAPLTTISTQNDQSAVQRVMNLLKEKKFWKGTFTMDTKQGLTRSVEATIVAFYEEKGDKVYQFLAVYHDITSLKVNEALMAAQNRHLEEKNKEVEQFAYIASHDLQEPLRTIINYSSLLKEDYEGQFDKTADISLNYIEGAAHRMSDLIKGVLDYSKLGVQKEKTTVDCNKILHEVRADLNEKLKETNVELSAALLPTITGHPTELRLLFQNLILNGIKFRRDIPNSYVHVDVSENKTEWIFRVIDNGIGIKEENVHKIFELFSRLHHAKAYEGTGIGLSHCQKIVTVHDGKIWVESEYGEGSIFYFTIPKVV